MTVLDAILAVLETENHGLTCRDITDIIQSRNLYFFNTNDPYSIVGQCLRRHCSGLDFASAAREKYFIITSGHRQTAVYGLKSQFQLPHDIVTPKSSVRDLLPEEKLQIDYDAHRDMIKNQLLDCILNNDPAFFEHLVVELLLSLGYGYGHEAGNVVGRSHDGGIDGIINEDKLGLDKIYIQAKRYAFNKKVGSREIQAFSGAMKDVSKGVFITTSSFTYEAKKEAADQYGKRIALIDGSLLTDLMIRCGVGIHTVKTFSSYEVDLEYFDSNTCSP